MNKPRLFWKLYPSYLLATVIALLVAFWLVGASIKVFYKKQIYEMLHTNALLVAHKYVSDKHFAGLKNFRVQKFCNELSTTANIRITIIEPDGTVVYDSHKDPKKMDNHADRPEIIKAKSGRVGSSIRYSHTLHQDMMYVAIPLRVNNKTVGIIRTSRSIAAINKVLGTIKQKIALWGVFALLLSAFLCFVISYRISRPIEKLTETIKSFPKIKQSGKVFEESHAPSREFVVLVSTLNRMATQIQQYINTIEHNRSELEAILSNMKEGLIAIDNDYKITVINKAAVELLEIASKTKVEGKFCEEVIKFPKLIEQIKLAKKDNKPKSCEIVLKTEPEKVIFAHIIPITDNEHSHQLKLLVVLNDITDLRQIERVRKDFVANVSHELKTPITAIKGFAETLLDGAIDDKDMAERFLKIINKHADRMNNIIQDLLTLAKLEQQEEYRESLKRETVSVESLIASAVEACKQQAESKKIEIKYSVPSNLQLFVNRRVIEQALINLVDNAVKYSDDNKSVKITAKQLNNGIVISVIDEGYGIPAEDLPRIFERFYRVDKGRSRELGGTGLGLAIVKHAVQIHGGRVEVKSELGKGSIFTLYLPA